MYAQCTSCNMVTVIAPWFQCVNANFGCSVMTNRKLVTVDPNFKRTTIWQFLDVTCWVLGLDFWQILDQSGRDPKHMVNTHNLWEIWTFSLFIFIKFGDSILYHLWGDQMIRFSWYCYDLCFQWPDASTEYFFIKSSSLYFFFFFVL
jgi:hypothetical protein